MLGSDGFVRRIRDLLKGRPSDPAVPQVRGLQTRPSLESIMELVSQHFGRQDSGWQTGQRSDDFARAVAAFLARRRYGYSATAVAGALGYRGHSSVNYAIARIDAGEESLATLLAELEQKLLN